MTSALQRPRDTETQAQCTTPTWAGTIGEISLAVCRAKRRRQLPVKGTAPHHPVTTVPRSRCSGRSVRRCPVVVAVFAVLHPLPRVAVHVVEAPRIGREGVHRRRVGLAGCDLIFVLRLTRRERRAPPVRRRCTRPRHVLPLRLREQPVRLPRLAAQPRQVLLGDLVPRHERRMLAVTSGTAPGRGAAPPLAHTVVPLSA